MDLFSFKVDQNSYNGDLEHVVQSVLTLKFINRFCSIIVAVWEWNLGRIHKVKVLIMCSLCL